MKGLRLAILAAALAIGPFPGIAQMSMQEFQIREWQDAMRALANPAEVQRKVIRIAQQLHRTSGKAFPIYPAQQGTMGQALHGGIVLLDLSVAAKRIEIVAFWLAHEWAHQDLSHSLNAYTTPAAAYAAWQRGLAYPSAREDDADAYAGRFLARAGYDPKPVYAELCRLPRHPMDIQHSQGPQRAKTVAAAFARARDTQPPRDPCAGTGVAPSDGPAPQQRAAQCRAEGDRCAVRERPRCHQACMNTGCRGQCGPPYGSPYVCGQCSQVCAAQCEQRIQAQCHQVAMNCMARR